MHKASLIFLGLLLLFKIDCFAQLGNETITITTYYPSPYGVYRNLRLYPSDEPDSSSPARQAGTLYFNSTGNTLYVFNENTKSWDPVAGGGGVGGYWAENATTHDIYNTNTGDVELRGDLRLGGNGAIYGLKGDCNGDGILDFKDVRYLFEYVEYPEMMKANCDINNNGNLDFNDVVQLYENNYGITQEQGTTYKLKCDVNGDGLLNFNDVAYLFENIENPSALNSDCDLNLNGVLDFNDVVRLAYETNLYHMAPTDSLYSSYFSGGLGVLIDGDARVNGNIYGQAFFYTSDLSLKTNVVPLKDSLKKLDMLNGISFQWKSNGRKDIGLAAQDVEKVFPELVSTDSVTGLKSVEYGNLIAVLIEAVKEQQKTIEHLEAEVAHLKQEK